MKAEIIENPLTDQQEIQFSADFEENMQDEVSQHDDKERKIFPEKKDPEIDSLYKKYKRGQLLIQPDFQRRYVWDHVKASRLVESTLLNVPIPIVYLSEEPDGRETVIDGQQRLTSFFAFIDGIFPDGSEFKLRGLNALPELNGKKYADLGEEMQNRISDYSIPIVIFRKESDSGLKFDSSSRISYLN